MTKGWIAAACLAAAGVVASADLRAELIVNGGFEAPLVTSSGPPPGLGFDYRTGADITGWLITGPKEPQFDTTYNPVGGGNQALQLESLDPVLQTFATTPGQLYQLIFDLSAYTNNDALLNIAPLQVVVAGVTADFVGTDLSYVTHSLFFTASGASTTLSFENTGAFGVNFPQIDDVSVLAAAVPEPNSVALLGFGLVVFALNWRRRRRD